MKVSKIKLEKESNVDIEDVILLLMGIIAVYMANRVFMLSSRERCIEGIMLVSILCVMVALYGGMKGWKYSLSVTQSIIAIGIILRVGYMLYTRCTDRGHDVGPLRKDSWGHASYFLYLIEDGQLPPTNDGQFYQQPFNYFLGSLISKVINELLGGVNTYTLVDAAKVVSCFASCTSLLIMKPFLSLCRVKKDSMWIGLAIVSFTPALILSSACLTCDALVMLFMLLEIMYTIKWYRETTWKHTILLAVIYGFGVLTKVSCGIFAIFTCIVFLYKLIRVVKKKEQSSLSAFLVKIIAFGCISLPLGLWYCVRNAILFGQSFAHVLLLSESNPLYTGNVPVLKRLFYFDWRNIINSPYAYPEEDYNAPVYYIKSSLFGEFTFTIPNFLARTLLAVSLVLAGITLVILIRKFIVKKGSRISFVIGSLFCMYYVSMLWFYVTHPFGCSMDYRYMMILTPLTAVLIGDYCDYGAVRGKTVIKGLVGIYGILCIVMFIFV